MDMGAGLPCARCILTGARSMARLPQAEPPGVSASPLPSTAAGPSSTGDRLLFVSLQDMPTRVDKSHSSAQFH